MKIISAPRFDYQTDIDRNHLEKVLKLKRADRGVVVKPERYNGTYRGMVAKRPTERKAHWLVWWCSQNNLFGADVAQTSFAANIIKDSHEKRGRIVEVEGPFYQKVFAK